MLPGRTPTALRREILARFQIELIELGVRGRALLGHLFGDCENGEEDDRESDSGNRRDLLGEEIDHAQSEQSERDQAEADGNLDVAES